MNTDDSARRKPGRPKKEGGPDPVRSIRSPDRRWKAAEGTLPTGKTMSDLVNDLLAWHLREPGAKQPKRPPAAPIESKD